MRNKETTRDIEVSEMGVQCDIFELEFELRSDTASTAAVSQSSAFEEGLEVWYFSDLTYTVLSVFGKMSIVVLRFTGRRLGFRIILLWLVVQGPGRDVSFAG